MNNKRNLILTLVAIVVLFGVACFVQAEVDSYIRRIVNLCLIYAIICSTVLQASFHWARQVSWLSAPTWWAFSLCRWSCGQMYFMLSP